MCEIETKCRIKKLCRENKGSIRKIELSWNETFLIILCTLCQPEYFKHAFVQKFFSRGDGIELLFLAPKRAFFPLGSKTLVDGSLQQKKGGESSKKALLVIVTEKQIL